jgi:hypothetical protein
MHEKVRQVGYYQEFVCVIIHAAPSSVIPPEVNDIKFKLQVSELYKQSNATRFIYKQK